MIGIVTWFNVAKGYGEIHSEKGVTYFFSYLDLPKSRTFRTIERGTMVAFESSERKQFSLQVACKIRLLEQKKMPQQNVAVVLQGLLK